MLQMYTCTAASRHVTDCRYCRRRSDAQSAPLHSCHRGRRWVRPPPRCSRLAGSWAAALPLGSCSLASFPCAALRCPAAQGAGYPVRYQS